MNAGSGHPARPSVLPSKSVVFAGSAATCCGGAQSLCLGILVGACLAGSVSACQSLPVGQPLPPLAAPQATPPGITLKATRGTVNAAGNDIPGPVAYADDQGRLIYIAPGLGRRPCVDECRAAWLPVLASSRARSAGDWELIASASATRQWSFKGNPLFVSKASVDAPDYERCHVGAARERTRPGEPSRAPWCVVLYEPAAELALPSGIAVREIPNVSAQGLVDGEGMTLYVLDSGATRRAEACPFSTCNDAWKPLAAAELARRVGQFAIVERSDRTRQWTYQGRPLYTFSGDTAAGDVNGLSANAVAQVAVISRYFTPPEVAIRMTPGFGTVWTTASGMTLYSQNRGGKNRNPSRPNANVVCDADCQKVWHPLTAAADAEASGYWSLAQRPDGARQWAYRGHLLFSYGLDEKPGDMRGEYLYEYVVRDPQGAVVAININVSRTDRPWFWGPAFPY
jgi:predicted lipoprotein with Yx(FWY)xxD motif